ncbi:glycosyltransferase family 4 protein [Paenibacillus sp. 1P07SE]|uniref:glycosyltransferase family 4 protein n=1 Tax=Paenibacillus sp. 1P07SE TaxID=3132209 RepID=UPI0039A6440F
MEILLAPTRPGWAFDHRAKDLLALQMRHIRCEIKYFDQITTEDQDKYDLIYPMTLGGAEILHEQKKIPLAKMAAGITSLRSLEPHMLDEKRFKPDFIRFVKSLRGINTASDEIVELFEGQCKIYKTRVGIDPLVFKPSVKRNPKQTFRVGWVGRIDKPVYRVHKGYQKVLSALKNMDVTLDIRTLKENYVPREEMVTFYQGLDCFICSSVSEHLPLPVLEAAACGVPIITTKVGIVPELIRHRRNGIIVTGSADSIRQATSYLMRHRKFRGRLKRRIRRTIEENWTWNHCKRDWERFFRKMHRKEMISN